jgi:hypothetical protein
VRPGREPVIDQDDARTVKGASQRRNAIALHVEGAEVQRGHGRRFDDRLPILVEGAAIDDVD